MMKTMLLAALALLVQSPLFAQDDGAPSEEAQAPAEAPSESPTEAPSDMAPPQGDGGDGQQNAAPKEEGEDYTADDLSGDQSAPVAAPAVPVEESVPAPKVEEKKPAKKVLGRKSKTADPSKGPPLPAPAAKADRPKTEAVAAVPLTPVFPNNP